MKKIILSSLLLSNLLYSSEVKYNGLTVMSELYADKLLGFNKNNEEEFTENNIRNAINNFAKEGYFNNVWITTDSEKNLIFNFDEKKPISLISIEGYKEELEYDKLEEYLGLKIGDYYDKFYILKIKDKIIRDLSNEGYSNSKVTVIKKFNKDGNIEITFKIKKGFTTIVKNVYFKGNLAISSNELYDIIVNKKRDKYVWWLLGFNDGTFKSKELDIDLLRLKEYYLEHGFLDVKINNKIIYLDNNDKIINKNNNFVDLEDPDNQRFINITFNINEGKQYRIENLELNVDNNIKISNINLKNKLKSLRNNIFNVTLLRKDIEKIKNVLGNYGYAYVEVVPRIEKKYNTVYIKLFIKTGSKVHINDVLIDGNNRTMDSVIRREIYLAPGDLFHKTNIIESEKALKRTGYFEFVKIIPEKVNEKEVNLHIIVKEQQTGTFQIGGGYGTYGGFLGTISVNDRNIFGSGIGTELKLEKSEKTSNYSFSISNPKLNDSDFSGNFSIYKSDNELTNYTIDTIGNSFGLGKKVSKNLHVYTKYNYNKTKYTEYDNNLISFEEDFESYTKSSVSINFHYNDTDSYFIASSGLDSYITFEKAGIVFGEANFFKINTNFNFFYSFKDIVNHDVIFRYKNKFSYLADTGFIPLSERFYLGGMNSVRGYQAYSISPIDNNEYKRGGTKRLVNTIEVSSAFSDKNKNIRGVFFFDQGFIGNDNLNEINKYSLGFGLEWFSPVGPLRIMYAKAINPEGDDSLSTIEFSLGQRF